MWLCGRFMAEVFFFVLLLLFFLGGLVLSSASGGSASYILSPQDQIDFGDYMGMSWYKII